MNIVFSIITIAIGGWVTSIGVAVFMLGLKEFLR